MIRLWLSRGTEIPIQEQLSAQLVLGILSRRLAPGERLPSVRGLARRLKLHPNTVSAVYQNLAHRGWVDTRRGSGVFVRHLDLPRDVDGVDRFARSCLDDALARGFSLEALWRSFGKLACQFQAQQFLVVDPDPQFARILAAEISQAISRDIVFAGHDQASQMLTPATCVLVTEASVLQILPALGPVNHRTIRLKSMQDFLIGRERPTTPVLIAVASRSESVLRWAWTLLSALGFPADSVLLRNPSHADWQNGLTSCDIVAADVVTAPEMAQTLSPVILRVVSDDFIAEMRGLLAP